MPVAQRYGQRQIGTAALPSARRTAAETATSRGAGLDLARAQTLGASAELAAQGAGIATNVASTIIATERARANDVALLEARNRLSAFERTALYDPERGALGVKGKDAMSLPKTIAEEYDALAGEIEQGLGNDAQRAAFAKLRSDSWNSIDMTVRRHVFGEMQTYEAGEVEATVKNAISAAIANAMDPRRVGQELDTAVATIRKHGPRLGLGPEQVEQQITAATSATHVGVIERLLANDQTRAAEIYFEEQRGQISGEAVAKVEAALEAGTLRAAAQKKTDEILAAGGTVTEMRDRAKAIDDPKLRDEVTQRIEHEAAVRDRAERETAEATLRSVYDVVDQTRDVTKIPPAVWAGLDGSQRSALRHYADQLARGVPVETDLATYYSLMRQAGDNPTAFATRNLLEFRGRLGETEFKQLAGLQLSIRGGDTKKADETLNGFRTTTQVFEDGLALYGIDPNVKPNTPEGVAVVRLRAMLDRRVEDFANTTGKKPSNADVRDILDGLLESVATDRTTKRGSWWSILPGGAPFFDQTDPKLIDMTAGEIPTDERRQIEQALRSAGRPATDATILELWIETKARQRRSGGR